MRVNKVIVKKAGKGYLISVDTVGQTGKRIRVKLGHLDDLSRIGDLVQVARETVKLSELLAVGRRM